MNINGFKVPAALEDNLHTDNYKLSENQTARLKAALNRSNSLDPEMYGYDNIIWENELWTAEDVEFYLGTPSMRYAPGNVDPKLTLIIGDTEPDSPIALDYRTAEPRVVCFCDIDNVSYWIELCPNYEGLLKIIGTA